MFSFGGGEKSTINLSNAQILVMYPHVPKGTYGDGCNVVPGGVIHLECTPCEKDSNR